MSRSLIACAALMLSASAAVRAQSAPVVDMHQDHAAAFTRPAGVPLASDSVLPAGAADVAARLAASPRHREWVRIPAGGGDSVGAWVIYPERRTKAPVVVVIHEIFGLSTWIEGVGDQLAADGFIAVIPDLITGKSMPGGPDSVSVDDARKVIATLKPEDTQRRIIAAANFGMHLPAALPKYGVVGFCWGGGTSFLHAALGPDVSAAVVYYGVSPDSTLIGKVHAPVLGLYGADDARVDMTIAPADSALRARHMTYDHFLFDGAGHGFLRDQAGRTGANMAATRQAWPKTIAWFRLYLEK